MIVEINVSRITDADQEFAAAGLFLGHDPRGRSTNLQDLVAAIGCETGDGRMRHGEFLSGPIRRL
jgi:hypothetical protein